MAEKKKNDAPDASDSPKAEDSKNDFGPMVKVSVKSAITVGGVVFRPTLDGKKVVPVTAIIPADAARSFAGNDYKKTSQIVVLGDAPEGAKIGLVKE